MPSKVSDKFIRFLNMVRKQAKLSTRELGQVLGKSAMYVSYLENGKIKTIDFDTAYTMLEAIYNKNPFVSGVVDGDSSPEALITDMLINTFGIEPEDLIRRRFEDEEKKQEAWESEIREIKKRTMTLSSLLDPEESPHAKELLDLMLQLARMDMDSETLECFNDCLTALKHPKLKEAVTLFFATLLPMDYGNRYPKKLTDEHEQYINSINQALIDGKYIKEEV